MPRIRTFKPEFFRSPDTARASHAARILYMAMWSWANDEGIGETNLNGLLGFAFPDEDQIERKELQRLLKEIRRVYGAVFYGNRGRFYFCIPSWDSHQKTERRANGRFPGPDDDDSYPDQRFGDSEEKQGNSDTKQGESSSGTGEPGNRGIQESTSLKLVEGGVGGDPPNLPVAAKAAPATRRKRIPDGYMPRQNLIDKVRAEFPSATDQALKQLHEDFCLYWQGQGKPMADWDATWLRWIRQELRKATTPARNNHGAGKPTQKAMGYGGSAERLIAGMEDHD